MNSRDVIRRLRAYQAGCPLPRTERLSIRIADSTNAMVLAFVRMGGESRPWGIAFGHPDDLPHVLTVPEGRDRDLVGEMAARFAPHLLAHVSAPGFGEPEASGPEDLSPLRQIWLPNQSHLEMVQQLAYAYTFTKAGGESQPLLNALGRACGWLFREAHRAGEQHIVVATRALREAYSFPIEDVRQGHLGYLLAWLRADGAWHDRLRAATDEERRSISTTLDPDLERKELEPLVEAWRSGRRAGTSDRPAERRIAEVLSDELSRRYRLTVECWNELRADPRGQNAAVEELVDEALSEQWWRYSSTEVKLARGDRVFIPPVETDRDGAAAAAMYERYSAAAESLAAKLIHDDRELLAEAIARGDAFVGTITAVRDQGVGRTTLPIWTITEERSGPMRLREGSAVSVVGLPRRTAEVRSIASDDAGHRVFELAITNLKTAIRGATGLRAVAPNDPVWKGQTLAFASASSNMWHRKTQKLWVRDVPGAWLTLSHSPRERPVPNDDREIGQVV